MASAAPTDVFVLDFDGVIVDSEPEVTMSGYTAAAQYWPEVFNGLSPEEEQTLKAGLRSVRPVLVKGFECMILARMLREDPGRVEEILESWEHLLPQMIEKYGLNEGEMKKYFEQHRNTIMTGPGSSEMWMQLNQPYAGVKELLQTAPFPFYIASSKAAHRISAICKDALGLDIPADSPRMFAALLPPNEAKIQALKTIEQRPVCQAPGVRLHFVDDRYETLKAMVDDGGLGRWNLYHAAWGYTTPKEVQEARATKGVQVIQLAEFVELMKWGILMGVDDGCEPTPEEVAAQV